MENNSSDAILVNCPTCSTEVGQDYLIPAGDATVCPNCRDEYLQRISEGATVGGDSEYAAIRQEHIKHEASLKSVGFLYYLGGAMMVFGVISMIGLGSSFTGSEFGLQGIMLAGMIVYALLGILCLCLGSGFRKLKRWVRIPSTILAALGLLSIPVGTLINGYILYLLWSQKGKMIFSAEYQDVIEATPDIKYRTPVWIWVILGLIVLALISAVVLGAASA